MGQIIVIWAVVFLSLLQVANISDMYSASNPAEILAEIGEDLIVPCRMNYSLDYFAWSFCDDDDCASLNAKWQYVIEIYDGNVTRSSEEKFDVLLNGSLVVKNIQPRNNNNWAQCRYKKRYVGKYHRSTVILIRQDSPKITMTSVQHQVVYEHTNLYLECGVKCYPIPWVAWIWNKQLVQNKTDGQQYFVRRRITAKDSGNYTCLAGNYLGTVNFTYKVTVRDATTKKVVEGCSSVGVGIGIGIEIGITLTIAMKFCLDH